MIPLQRKRWTAAELAFLTNTCSDNKEMRRLIESRRWAEGTRLLVPLLRDVFYAKPLAAESPADFVARYTAQHRSGHARKCLERRTRPETEAEYTARVSDLPRASAAIFLSDTKMLIVAAGCFLLAEKPLCVVVPAPRRSNPLVLSGCDMLSG